jgi:hypothetical protein
MQGSANLFVMEKDAREGGCARQAAACVSNENMLTASAEGSSPIL